MRPGLAGQLSFLRCAQVEATSLRSGEGDANAVDSLSITTIAVFTLAVIIIAIVLENLSFQIGVGTAQILRERCLDDDSFRVVLGVGQVSDVVGVNRDRDLLGALGEENFRRKLHQVMRPLFERESGDEIQGCRLAKNQLDALTLVGRYFDPLGVPVDPQLLRVVSYNFDP